MHADLPETFAGALLDPTRAPPDALTPATRSRFAIHRNNLFSGLVGVLAARHPVCRALVGPEFFAAAARVFVELSPPVSPVLLAWGDGFGDFLE
ncbi:MAG TPA: DNA-binding domain-containing protein, partial [Beijerinckiaceae bacterium]|nr:DNA-binding domain-containing protein [Beijerinckiaceae bacterium]